jgi:hypothetical protein
VPYYHRLPIRQQLMLLIGIDSIFPYQFLIYMMVWVWGLYDGFGGDPAWWVTASMGHWTYMFLTGAYLLGPPATFVGYIIPNKIAGVGLNLSGDSSMAFAIGAYSATMFSATGFSLAFLLVLSLSLCMFTRALRDLSAIILIHRAPPELDEDQLKHANRVIENKKVETILEMKQTREMKNLKKADHLLKETQRQLKNVSDNDGS